MPAQDNEQIVRQYVEQVMNQRNAAAFDQFVDPSFVGHGPDGDLSYAQSKQRLTEQLNASTDARYTIDNLTSQGDQVSFQWTVVGTHSGQFMGKPGSGKHGTLTGNTTVRLANGKIVESTNQYDLQSLMSQL